MAEKYPAINGRRTADSDWPSLIERAVDDISRIVQSEAQIFQTRLSAAIELRISSAMIVLAAVGVIVTGALCLLCAAIFLLHQWLPWWQAFGIAGGALVLVGIVCYATMRPRSEVRA
jgi:hypothetical protein